MILDRGAEVETLETGRVNHMEAFRCTAAEKELFNEIHEEVVNTTSYDSLHEQMLASPKIPAAGVRSLLNEAIKNELAEPRIKLAGWIDGIAKNRDRFVACAVGIGDGDDLQLVHVPILAFLGSPHTVVWHSKGSNHNRMRSCCCKCSLAT